MFAAVQSKGLCVDSRPCIVLKAPGLGDGVHFAARGRLKNGVHEGRQAANSIAQRCSPVATSTATRDMADRRCKRGKDISIVSCGSCEAGGEG